MPAISVIITLYNKKNTLAACVASVLQQSFADFELLIVNDGSTDGSGPLADALCAGDVRMRVLHQANGGVRSAVVTGVSAATAAVCGFVDADDELDPKMLETLFAAMQAENADCVCCGMAAFGGDKAEALLCPKAGIYERTAIENNILSPFFEQTASLRPLWSDSRCDKLFKTELLRVVLPKLDMGMCHREDYEVNLRVLPLCEKVVVLADGLYRYRRAEGSFTRVLGPGYADMCLYSARVLQRLAAEQDRRGKALDNLYQRDLRLGFYIAWKSRAPLSNRLSALSNVLHALVAPQKYNSKKPSSSAWKAAAAICYAGYCLYQLALRILVPLWHGIQRLNGHRGK